jgi:proteasome lid subunit RPN8/RPN11
MLSMTVQHRDAIVAACIRALPNEGCGLLVGTREGHVREVVASANVADSAKVYEIDPKVLLHTYRRAEDEGLDVIGVFHSHTHSVAFPSPTDVGQAPDPAWHYLLVSLRDVPVELRSFRIRGEEVDEEEISVAHGGAN